MDPCPRAAFRRGREAWRWLVPSSPARAVDGLFFPMDLKLGLSTEGYSPRILRKIEYAGGNAPSFAQAHDALTRLAEITISAKHIERLTERLGQERQAQRDATVEAFQKGVSQPRYQDCPAVVAIHLDAGKIQLRTDDGAPGVRLPHWGDTKVACLASYGSPPEDGKDPQPEPPAAFVNPARVARLCSEMERVRSQPAVVTPPAATQAESAATSEESEEDERKTHAAPSPLLRTAIATMGNCEQFGWLVSAEAHLRGFYGALRRAIVGDGGNWIVPLAQMHFHDWVQVLDFLHLLVHLYAAAQAAWSSAPRRAWTLYLKLLQQAWGGQVGEVLRELERHAHRLGDPPPKASDADPRRRLARVIHYIRENATRMDYPRYRREGLPTSSALVESLIKQFNKRVKGSEKFWIDKRAEAVLQVRAAYLSEDDRAEQHYGQRALERARGKRQRSA